MEDMRILKWVMNHRYSSAIVFSTFLVLGLLIGATFSLLTDQVSEDPDVVYIRPFDCASHIESLPEEYVDDVNASCNDWMGRGIVERADLRRWFARNEVHYVEEPFFWEPNLLGYVRYVGTHWEFWVKDYDDILDISIPGVVQRRTAYHEAGHIALLAAGIEISGEVHHQMMDELELCPDACPSDMEY